MTLKLPRAPRRSIAGVVVALLVSLLTIVDSGLAPSPARAADPIDPVYQSTSGGTRVSVGGVVRSELTAMSHLRVEAPNRSSENKTADLDVLGGLIKATAVSTYQRTTRNLLGATTITSQAKIAGVSLLGGAITVDAVETKAAATLSSNGEVSRTGGTKFVGIHVQDNHVPLNVPRNLTLTIPGLAKVVLNKVTGQLGGDALIKSIAAGIHITLLQPYGGLNAGASIEVTPATARILLPTPIDGTPIFGAAYSTRATIQVGDELRLASAPTSLIIAPAGGTNGHDLTNAAAKVNLPGLITANGLSNTANGTVTSNESDGTMKARVADVSLLGGAITLDAAYAQARVVKTSGRPATTSGAARIVGLVINGREIPIGTARNTVIEIPGLVKVIINEHITIPGGRTVRALHVIALPGAPEDVAGLDLELGVAAIRVFE